MKKGRFTRVQDVQSGLCMCLLLPEKSRTSHKREWRTVCISVRP